MNTEDVFIFIADNCNCLTNNELYLYSMEL